MTPEGRQGRTTTNLHNRWNHQKPKLVYQVVPQPKAPPSPPTQYSLIYTQPLRQPQILQAVQAVQSLPLTGQKLPPAKKNINQFYRERKKNVKPITAKHSRRSNDAIQDPFCKNPKKAECRSELKPSTTKVTRVKMREEFILRPDKGPTSVVKRLNSDDSDDDESPMRDLEPQVKSAFAAVSTKPKSNSNKVGQNNVSPRRKPCVRQKPRETEERDRRTTAKDGSEDDTVTDGGDIIKTLQKQVEDDDSDLDLFVPPVKETDSEENGETAFEKLLTSSHSTNSKREKNPAWSESPPKRDKVSPTDNSLAVVTAPWGAGPMATFDLSDDYVNDYLKDKAKTDSTKSPDPAKPPGLLMISPTSPRRAGSRTVSMDVIPACLPDSVGDEIGDILRGGFLTISPPAPRNSRKGGRRTSGRASPQKPGGGGGGASKDKLKNTRTKSTEDLPPNLLPEDYLDEVIGQYFNNDSSSDDEPRKDSEKVENNKPSINTDSEDESSDEDAPVPHTSPKKVRSRPPASFFSMDFLDEPAHLDNSEERLEKIKTDLEIETEYRHILYGGKKRRPAKIGSGKKKKAPSPNKVVNERLRRKHNLREKDEKANREERIARKAERALKAEKALKADRAVKAEKTLKTERIVKMENREKTEKTEKIVNKQKTTVLRETNGKTKQVIPKVHTEKKPVQTSRAKSPAKEKEPVVLEKKFAEVLHSWRGKKPNTRAYERSKMFEKTVRHRPNVSAKIEDVTGRYSKEEESAACGICEMLDPPVDPDSSQAETTEWVGCDCYRWFHKGCTNLTKFTEKFSCKSVKMKCLELEEIMETPTPQPEVIRIAILKFCRDRDTIFIDDTML